jgi:hypothetical protein
VLLALAGVVAFTQDPTGTPSAMGDALCILAAIFYATYDLQLFLGVKKVSPRQLITSKIGTQGLLLAALLLTIDWQASFEWLSSDPNWAVILERRGAIFAGGRTTSGRANSMPNHLCLSTIVGRISQLCLYLGKTIGIKGAIGGTAFLSALFLAATAEAPDADCVARQIVKYERFLDPGLALVDCSGYLQSKIEDVNCQQGSTID